MRNMTQGRYSLIAINDYASNNITFNFNHIGIESDLKTIESLKIVPIILGTRLFSFETEL